MLSIPKDTKVRIIIDWSNQPTVESNIIRSGYEASPRPVYRPRLARIKLVC